MNKTKILTAVFVLLSACAYKLPEEKIVRIFERHGFSAHDPEKLRALLKEGGLAGLKAADRYVEVLRAKRQLKISPKKPGPSAGMLVGTNGGAYYLLRVFKGSPAEAAGLKDGDRLLAVNAAAAGSEEFLKALAGKPEYKIKASRRSKTGVSEFEAEVKGGEFYLPLVFGLYEPETRSAFVRIGLFFGESSSMAAAGLAGLQKYGVKSVILDLRGNRGGDPAEAAALLNFFAAKPGPVLAVSSRHRGYTQVYEAAARGRFAGLRVVVLVDQTTSMAGEVFAASLRELAGAAVVGSRTAGNVSIQKTFSIGDGRGLKLTVARLAPPSEKDLEEAGLLPDVPVEAAGGPAWSPAPADALLKDAVYLRALETLVKKAP